MDQEAPELVTAVVLDIGPDGAGGNVIAVFMSHSFYTDTDVIIDAMAAARRNYCDTFAPAMRAELLSATEERFAVGYHAEVEPDGRYMSTAVFGRSKAICRDVAHRLYPHLSIGGGDGRS